MDFVERRTLFVGNLSQEVTEALLHELCLQAGPVESVVLARPKKLRDAGKKQGDKPAAPDTGDDGTKTVMYNANGFHPSAPFRREDEVAYVEVRGCYYFIQNNASYYAERQVKTQVADYGDAAKENVTEVEKSEEDAKELEKGTDKEEEQNGIKGSRVGEDTDEKEAKVPESDVSASCDQTVSDVAPSPDENLAKDSEQAPSIPENIEDRATTAQKNDPPVQEKDFNPNKHLGYGFVLFEHECSVAYAIQVFRGTELFGRRLTLQFKSKNAAKPNRVEPDNNIYTARYQPDNNYSNARWHQTDTAFYAGWHPNPPRGRGKRIYNFHDARLNTYQGNRYSGSRGYAKEYWNERQEFPDSVSGANFRLASGNRDRNVSQDEFAYNMSNANDNVHGSRVVNAHHGDFAYTARSSETLRQSQANRYRNEHREDSACLPRSDESIRVAGRHRDRNAAPSDYAHLQRAEDHHRNTRRENSEHAGETASEYENCYSTKGFANRAAVDSDWAAGYEGDYQQQEAAVVESVAGLSLEEKSTVDVGGRPPRKEGRVRENADGNRERRVGESNRRRGGRPTHEDFALKYDKGETDANARKKPSECLVKLSESFDVALDKFLTAKLEGEEQDQVKRQRRRNRKK